MRTGDNHEIKKLLELDTNCFNSRVLTKLTQRMKFSFRFSNLKIISLSVSLLTFTCFRFDHNYWAFPAHSLTHTF